MVPAIVVVVDDLPRNPAGKLDRAALPAPDLAALSTGVAPRTGREAALAAPDGRRPRAAHGRRRGRLLRPRRRQHHRHPAREPGPGRRPGPDGAARVRRADRGRAGRGRPPGRRGRRRRRGGGRPAGRRSTPDGSRRPGRGRPRPRGRAAPRRRCSTACTSSPRSTAAAPTPTWCSTASTWSGGSTPPRCGPPPTRCSIATPTCGPASARPPAGRWCRRSVRPSPAPWREVDLRGLPDGRAPPAAGSAAAGRAGARRAAGRAAAGAVHPGPAGRRPPPPGADVPPHPGRRLVGADPVPRPAGAPRGRRDGRGAAARRALPRPPGLAGRPRRRGRHRRLAGRPGRRRRADPRRRARREHPVDGLPAEDRTAGAPDRSELVLGTAEVAALVALARRRGVTLGTVSAGGLGARRRRPDRTRRRGHRGHGLGPLARGARRRGRWSGCSSTPSRPGCRGGRTSPPAPCSTGCSPGTSTCSTTSTWASPASSGRSPAAGELFDTLVVFENTPLDAAAVRRAGGGLEVGRVDVHDATHYPLSLVAVPGVGPDGRTVESLRLRVDRTTALVADVDAATVATLAAPPAGREWPQTTPPPVRRPVGPRRPSDRRALDAAAAGAVHPLAPTTLTARLRAQAAATPGAEAVVCGDDRLSYARAGGPGRGGGRVAARAGRRAPSRSSPWRCPARRRPDGGPRRRRSRRAPPTCPSTPSCPTAGGRSWPPTRAATVVLDPDDGGVAGRRAHRPRPPAPSPPRGSTRTPTTPPT